MPEIIPGIDTQQKVSVVVSSQVAIQAEIDAQAADITGGWLVDELVLSGTDMVILFTRNIAVIPT